MFLTAAMSLTIHAADYLPRAPQFAAPRSCTAIDYRARLGPARTMGDNAYCFAYSSAVLVTQRTGVDVSALDLATGFYFGSAARFNQMVSRSVQNELGPDYDRRLSRETSRVGVDIDGPLAIFPRLEGGFEASTMAWTNARGLCPDKNLPAQGGTDAFKGTLRRMLKEARAGFTAPSSAVDDIPARFRGRTSDLVNGAWMDFARARCKARPAPVDILPVDFGLTGTSKEFLRARREGQLTEGDQSRVLAALDFALDHDRVAAIGFDLNTVQGHRGYIDEDGDHSVAVVGRRSKDGECQYLIRDSAGDPCSTFDQAVRSRCAKEHYWLTESELRRSLYSVTYLR